MALKAIDGSKDKLAPKPPRQSLAQSVFTVVQELGGADEKQARKYLPTVITDSKGIFPQKKVDKALYYLVYHGHLIHNGQTGKYYVAPMSYYKERRKVIEKQRKNHSGARPGPLLTKVKPTTWQFDPISFLFGLLSPFVIYAVLYVIRFGANS